MTDEQTREENAANAGIAIMDENSGIWTGSASISAKVTAIKANLVTIGIQKGKQGANTLGNRTSKKDAKLDGAEKALEVSKVLILFAADTNDTVLRDEVRYTISGLNSVKDSTAVDRWTMIRDRASSNAGALTTGGYLITPADVTALTTLIGAFVTWSPKPVQAKAAKKTATGLLKVEFGKMEVNKSLMLGGMAPYARTNAEFYGQAMDGFEVINSGNRNMANRFVFVDDETGVRLKGIDVLCVDLGLLRKSSDVGVVTYMYEETGNGNYNYTFKLKRYVDGAANGVMSNKGELVRMEVRMKKI